MSCILSIDTSTNVCSVAVSENGACIYHDEDKTGPNHAEKLGVFVDQAMSFTDSHAIPFDAVAVSSGPGSYTGLRIGALLCPMIDARRMEVYAAVYDRSLREVRETGADVVTADTYKAFLDRGPVYFFGNGAAKCMEVINHPNAHLIEGIEPEARWMFPLAERRIMQEQFEDVAYFVPHYLKDFVSKKPKSLL